jgi:hypothetical protein
MRSLRLFISHSHEDKQLADALKALIRRVFPPRSGQTVRVDYSSDDAPGGGIEPGSRWLEWIRDVVREADVCVVILTADSVTAPWLTWEAGAATGVAMATATGRGGGHKQATVMPMLFGITADYIPAPLRHQEAVNGERPNEILRLLYTLHKLVSKAGPFAEEAAKRSVARFIRDVQGALRARVLARPMRLRLADRSPIRFVNSRNGLTLEPRDGEIANGARLECGRLTGDAHQEWLMYPVDETFYRIVTLDTTKCISVENNSRKAGATIVLWDYEQDQTQHWRIITDVGTADTLATLRIVNRASNMCLEPRPADKQVVQGQIANFSDQDWWLLAAPALYRSSCRHHE